jgi:hypothetical protein
MRFVDDTGFAIGWIAPEPRFMQRTAHAFAAAGRVWVIDPIEGDGVLERVAELGDPAGVVQLLDRHGRDCAAVARELGVPHYTVPEAAPAGAPFEIVPVLRRRRWHEVALWIPEHRTLVCADALGTAPYYRARSERIAVSPLLRIRPPRVFLRYEAEHVLVGHGEGVHDDAQAAVRDAIANALRRLPAWAASALRALRR